MERLLRHPDAAAMLADHALCERVVEWKSRVFARQWARYDLARPGTFRFLPNDERRAALSRDYAQMRAMFIALHWSGHASPSISPRRDTLPGNRLPHGQPP